MTDRIKLACSSMIGPLTEEITTKLTTCCSSCQSTQKFWTTATKVQGVNGFISRLKLKKMNNTSVNMENASEAASMIVRSKAEGIALCSAFILECVFIVVGNLFVIILFVVNKGLRKKSPLLVINMAFADLMLGTLALPIYICRIGTVYKL